MQIKCQSKRVKLDDSGFISHLQSSFHKRLCEWAFNKNIVVLAFYSGFLWLYKFLNIGFYDDGNLILRFVLCVFAHRVSTSMVLSASDASQSTWRAWNARTRKMLCMSVQCACSMYNLIWLMHQTTAVERRERERKGREPFDALRLSWQIWSLFLRLFYTPEWFWCGATCEKERPQNSYLKPRLQKLNLSVCVSARARSHSLSQNVECIIWDLPLLRIFVWTS